MARYGRGQPQAPLFLRNRGVGSTQGNAVVVGLTLTATLASVTAKETLLATTTAGPGGGVGGGRLIFHGPRRKVNGRWPIRTPEKLAEIMEAVPEIPPPIPDPSDPKPRERKRDRTRDDPPGDPLGALAARFRAPPTTFVPAGRAPLQPKAAKAENVDPLDTLFTQHDPLDRVFAKHDPLDRLARKRTKEPV